MDYSQTEQPPLMKVFEGILASQSFELVESFNSEDVWESLLPQEKELLAQLFSIHAERLHVAKESHQKILKALQSACALTPHKARVWFKLGSHLALSDTVDSLNLAKEALERSLQLDDGFFDAWYTLANIFVRLTLKTEEEKFLLSAHKVFERGSCQFEKNTTTTEVGCPAPFYWHWGLSWFLFGRASGEPCDIQHALILYKKALSSGLQRPDFLNDYANSLIEFAVLTGQTSLVDQAIHLYEDAILYHDQHVIPQKEQAVHYFNLACCYQQKFESSYGEDLFERSSSLYKEASDRNPEMAVIWFKWGQLLYSAAKHWQDLDIIEEAIQKFEIASRLGHDTPVLNALWSESEVYIAASLERADLLSTALYRAQKALEVGEEFVECWHSVAFGLFEVGRYFMDPSFFDQSRLLLEKALVKHPKSASLWHLYGVLKGVIGELTQSSKLLHESILCFHIVSQSQVSQNPGFWSDWGVVLLNLAEVLQDERLAHESIEKFEKAIESVEVPDPQWFFSCGWAFDLLGEFLDQAEFYERAVRCFDLAYDEDQEFITARLQAGVSLLHLGELTGQSEPFKQAVNRFEQYLEAEYEDDLAWEDLSLCFLHLYALEPSTLHYVKAEEALNQLLALGNSRGHYYLACLNAMSGALVEAIDDLGNAFSEGAIPTPHELENEIWLSDLQSNSLFKELLDAIKCVHRAYAIGELAQEAQEDPNSKFQLETLLSEHTFLSDDSDEDINSSDDSSIDDEDLPLID